MHRENCPKHLESIQHAIRGQKKKKTKSDWHMQCIESKLTNNENEAYI
jgi:hypothetical protein